MNCEEIEQLVDLYVLGALEPPELEQVEEHLADCAPCRTVVAASLDVARLLRLSVPSVEPSASVHARLIEAVRLEGESRSNLRVLAPPSPVRRRLLSGGRRPWFPRGFAVRLAAAAALIPLVLSGWLAVQVANLSHEVESISLESQRVRLASERMQVANERIQSNAFVAAEFMERAQGAGAAVAPVWGTEMAPGASGVLYYVQFDRQAVLVCEGLPRLPSEQVYQVWVTRGPNRMSAGFIYPEDGTRIVVPINMPMPVTEMDSLNITNEPRGGSPQPRGEGYMWSRLKSS